MLIAIVILLAILFVLGLWIPLCQSAKWADEKIEEVTKTSEDELDELIEFAETLMIVKEEWKRLKEERDEN